LEVLVSPTAVAQEVSDATGTHSAARNHQSKIRTGDLVVDLETRVVTADGKPVRLTAKEYSILELFSLRQGVTVTKEMLLGHLYDGQHEPELKIIHVFCLPSAQKAGAGDRRQTMCGDRLG
jgi:DNA-binding response OmpR family regulator